MKQAPTKPFDYDQCVQYVQDEIFKLQPPDYCIKYPKWPGLVGIEIEMLPIFSPTTPGEPPSPVPLFTGPANLSTPLTELAADMENWRGEWSAEDRMLMSIKLEENDQLTFEPGGQLEFSSSPYPCLSDALQRAHKIQKILDEKLNAAGIQLNQTGINPWHTVERIGLQMPKARYRAMNQYFAAISPFGPRMMRQTCTLQINLDFGASESRMARRFLASQLIAPFATAIFSNSPFIDGEQTPFHSFRSHIWQQIDRTRTGFPHLDGVLKNMNKQSVVEAYLQSVLNAGVVFVEQLNHRVGAQNFTFRDWLENPVDQVSPTLADLKTHLSLHFPEVRARGFLELRSLDCQARTFQDIPGAFYTGLLYNDDALDRTIELLTPHANELYALWERSSYGLTNKQLAQTALQLFDIAVAGFQKLPSCFREECAEENFMLYRNHFTARQRSPADDFIDRVRLDGVLDGTTLLKLEDSWGNMLVCP